MTTEQPAEDPGRDSPSTPNPPTGTDLKEIGKTLLMFAGGALLIMMIFVLAIASGSEEAIAIVIVIGSFVSVCGLFAWYSRSSEGKSTTWRDVLSDTLKITWYAFLGTVIITVTHYLFPDLWIFTMER